jgi:hypothetical protein
VRRAVLCPTDSVREIAERKLASLREGEGAWGQQYPAATASTTHRRSRSCRANVSFWGCRLGPWSFGAPGERQDNEERGNPSQPSVPSAGNHGVHDTERLDGGFSSRETRQICSFPAMRLERQSKAFPSAPMPGENTYGVITRAPTIEAAIMPAPIKIACCVVIERS